MVHRISRNQQAFRSRGTIIQNLCWCAPWWLHALSTTSPRIPSSKCIATSPPLTKAIRSFPGSAIAVNTALTALQVTRTQNRVALDAELREEASLDQAIEQNELILQMQKEIAGLPEEQRTVFVLRTQQEMSYEEIAAALNLSLGTVMSRLSRARSRLKESLREYI